MRTIKALGFRQLLALTTLLITSYAQSQPYVAEGFEGSAERGRLAFASCRTCHYPEKIVGHNNGPNLHDIFSKQIGQQSGFDYSPAMASMEGQWLPLLLDVFLQDPSKFIPGNMMMQLPIDDPQRRADIIEYLKTFKD